MVIVSFIISHSFHSINLIFYYLALAASGARILTNLVYEMKRRSAKYAIGSACIGGGQGISVLLENVD